ALGAIADKAAGLLAGEIDAERDAIGEVGLVDVNQLFQRMQRVEFVRIEDRLAGAKANLREPRAFAQQDRKRLGTDLGIKRTVIAGADHVEAARAVRDDAGESVEP